MKKRIIFTIFIALNLSGCQKQTVKITFKYMEIDNIYLYSNDLDGFNFCEVSETASHTYTYEFEKNHVLTYKELEQINEETTFNAHNSFHVSRTPSYKVQNDVRNYDDIVYPGTVLNKSCTFYYAIL